MQVVMKASYKIGFGRGEHRHPAAPPTPQGGEKPLIGRHIMKQGKKP
jgi:hypothetical protein